MISSFCGGGGCVDVEFVKSSFSGIDCVAVRDTKDRSKPPHVFTREEWFAFTQGVKAGEFDPPGGNGGD